MNQTFNFSAGPAVMPHEVLLKAQEELINYRNSGMSVMELSHRSQIFADILEHAKATLKEIMNIPDSHSILFLQGGASLQFHMIPLNFGHNRKVAYIDTGNWSLKAIEEAQRLCEVDIIASGKSSKYCQLPEYTFDSSQDYAYIHLTTNNTLEGTAFTKLPDTQGTPLIIDASSNILSCEIDVSKCALIYAGAQKNIGMAGTTLVIIDNNFLPNATSISPMLSYKTMIENNSLYNTPSTYGIYIAGLVFDWVKSQGGVAQMIHNNTIKANLLYQTIDASPFYSSPVHKQDRSLTNIPFKTPSKELDALFTHEANQRQLVNLEGHRLIGGMRASLYNAFPLAGVQALVDFMKEFEDQHQ